MSLLSLSFSRLFLLALALFSLSAQSARAGGGMDSGGGDVMVCSFTLVKSDPSALYFADYFPAIGPLRDRKTDAPIGPWRRYLWISQLSETILNDEIRQAINRHGVEKGYGEGLGDRTAARISSFNWVSNLNLPELEDDHLPVSRKRTFGEKLFLKPFDWFATGVFYIYTLPAQLGELATSGRGFGKVRGIDVNCQKAQLAIQEVATRQIEVNPERRKLLPRFESVGLDWHEGLLGEIFPELAGNDTRPLQTFHYEATIGNSIFIESIRKAYWEQSNSQVLALAQLINFSRPLAKIKGKRVKNYATLEEYEGLLAGDLKRAAPRRWEAKLFGDALEGDGRCEQLNSSAIYDKLRQLIREKPQMSFSDLARTLFGDPTHCTYKVAQKS